MPESPSSPLSLGAFIRRQRELAELPMRQLAAMTGISNPYLSQIENGLRRPSEHVLRELARSLQVSVDELLAATTGTGRPGGDAVTPVLAAVRDDPDLTAAQRRSLIETYAAMREVTRTRREQGHDPIDGAESG